MERPRSHTILPTTKNIENKHQKHTHTHTSLPTDAHDPRSTCQDDPSNS